MASSVGVGVNKNVVRLEAVWVCLTVDLLEQELLCIVSFLCFVPSVSQLDWYDNTLMWRNAD